MRGRGSLLQEARVMLTHHHYLLSASHATALLRPSAAAAMSSNAAAIPSTTREQKKALRSRIRRELKAFPSPQRAQEDIAIQNNILNSMWFKSSTRLCAYISCEALQEVDTSRIISEVLQNLNAVKKLYVPRVEDKNSNMRMINISSIKDLVANSMSILEPTTTDVDGNEREDAMLASHPVDIFLLPGVAFDRQGRRLGRGGGYYDVFLKRYQAIAMERKWRQPLLVALAYSLQIMEDDVIPVTSDDAPIDAIVAPSGVIPISPAALERM